MRRAAALIAGGGPAGSAAAITLCRAGARPLLIERNRETGDALCGGFLSWHTLSTLDGLGIDTDALGGAPIDRIRIFTRNRSAEAALPRAAIGLSRRTLDRALIGEAERLGTAVERGVAVREAGEDRRLRLDDGGEIVADALLLATGKHDLRGLARPHASDDPALGLRVRLGPSPVLAGLIGSAIELHLFDRGYAGLLLQDDGTANLCLAVRKSRFTEAGGKPALLIEAIGRELPALGERLAWLDASTPIDAIGAVPYGWRADATAQGIFRLGDQSGVIASLAGEGIGIALASGIAAAKALASGGPAAATAYQRDFRKRLARPIGVARFLLVIGERPQFAGPATALFGRAPAVAALLAKATRIGAT